MLHSEVAQVKALLTLRSIFSNELTQQCSAICMRCVPSGVKCLMAGKTTLRDIANEAGVSVSAVSRVLNGGSGRISQEKRDLILEIARKRHYLPNQVARSLVMGRSRVLGLVVPSIISRTYTAIIDGLEELCQEAGYGLFITNSSDNPKMDVELVNLLVERGVDGIFLVPSNEAAHLGELTARINSLPVPCVLVGRSIEGFKGCDCVYCDNELGGYIATNHLIENGHKRIAFAADITHSNTACYRMNGYTRALHEVGLEEDPDLIYDAKFNMNDGYRVGLDMLKKDVHAVFAGSDYIALGIRKAYIEAGLSIPEDLSVVAFDHSESDFLLNPPMSAMIQDMKAISASALRLLINRLDEAFVDDPKEIVLEPVLQVGATVAKVSL